MIDYFWPSENINISINEDKKSYYSEKNNSFINQNLPKDFENKYTHENLDLIFEKDFEEIPGLFHFNINNRQNIKEEKNESFGNNIKNNYINKFIIKKGQKIFDIKKEIELGRMRKNSLKKGKHDKYQ